jgi:hypothetical protein
VGLALGSIEGRVAVEFLEDLGIPAGKSLWTSFHDPFISSCF